MRVCSTSDFVIVGAGSAGSVLANRLSAESSVTLIEAGPNDRRWDFRLHMPAALSLVLANDRYNWFYRSEDEPGLDNRRIYCPRGRVLGGSSSINGMIYVRGNPRDFDGWAARPGLEDWSYGHCLPYFKRAEACDHGDPKFRGRDGPLFVGRGEAKNPLFKAWLAAAREAGIDETPDFNGCDQEGVGVFDANIKSGRRFSAARAYLHPVWGRANLSVVKKALVTRVALEGRRAVGVEYLSDGRVQSIRADREVIVCAGAINSPQLLMLSGIGDANALSKLNIPVVCHLPGVGRNLQDHLEVYVQFGCSKPVSIYPALKWFNQLGIGLEWYITHKGLGASNHFEAGAFLRSRESVAYPDLQFHFLPVAMTYDGAESHDGHGFQVHVGPMRPTSRGSVTLRTSNPKDPPRIVFNYNTSNEDRDVMRRGIRMARELIGQGAFDEYRGDELMPGPDVSTDDELDGFVRRHSESAYHPSCTCAMGTDAPAVVDSQARVHGIDALRVVDASIMPDITNGNLHAPVIMMAEKLSDVIVGKQPLEAQAGDTI